MRVRATRTRSLERTLQRAAGAAESARDGVAGGDERRSDRIALTRNALPHRCRSRCRGRRWQRRLDELGADGHAHRLEAAGCLQESRGWRREAPPTRRSLRHLMARTNGGPRRPDEPAPPDAATSTRPQRTHRLKRLGCGFLEPSASPAWRGRRDCRQRRHRDRRRGVCPSRARRRDEVNASRQ